MARPPADAPRPRTDAASAGCDLDDDGYPILPLDRAVTFAQLVAAIRDLQQRSKAANRQTEDQE